MPAEFNRSVQWVRQQAVNPTIISRYGVAVMAVLAATGVRFAFNPVVGVSEPTVLFAIAVIAASWFGGRGPGLAATALGALSGSWFFSEPANSFSFARPEEIWALTLFVLEGALIALLVGNLRKSLLAQARAEDISRRQAHLIDLSHDAVVTLDAHRRVITWNKGATEMYGWSEREAVGKVFHELTQTVAPIPVSEVDRILHREGRWDGELSRMHRDGHRIFVESRQVLFRGRTGSPACILAISRDITRRKEIEEDLRESEEQFRTLADAIPNLAGMAYPDGMLFWLNQRWSDYTGLTLEESEGAGWLAAIDREASPGATESWEHSIASGEPLESVFAVRGADGIARPFLCRAVPLRDSAGRVARWFGTMTDISEQRRTEEALRKAHGELQAVMDAMPISLLIARDPECRVVLGNRRAYQVVHLPPGKNLADFAADDEQPPAFRLTEKVAATGQSSYSRELELVLADGSQANIIVNAVPLLDSEARPSGAVGVFWDITERKRNEECLRESEDRLRLAQQVARLGAFEWDLQTGVDRWTPELEALYGLPPGGFAGTFQAWQEMVHPADRAEAVRRVQLALETGVTCDAEYRVIQPNGSVRWLFGRARTVADRSGKPQRLVGVNMDITERKAGEEALRENEARLQFVLDAANLGAWEFDIEHRNIVWRSRRDQALFGYQFPVPEWTYETFLDHVVPEDRAEFDRAFREFAASGTDRLLQHEFRIRRADGEVRWMRTEARLRRAEDGEGLRMLGVTQDFTERKKAEEHLRYAQKMESIGKLAGGVAHDFNNLLTVIMGNADCALTEHPDSEHIQQILTGSQRAAYLTRQLLAYAGKGLFFHKKTLDLGDLVCRCMQLLLDSVPRKVTLHFDNPADQLLIEADPTQIEQIVVNLVTNAGEAIPPDRDGRIEVSVSLCDITLEMIPDPGKGWDVKPGRFVCLDVADNGNGMDEPTLAKAFDPFFTTKFTGRGLGLSEVLGIVRSYHGFIEVQSSPGGGAAFRVFLPAAGETASMDHPIGTRPGASSGEDRTQRSAG